VYDGVRRAAAFLERDRPMEDEVSALAAEIAAGRLG
jgi:hypothetical protein